MVKIRPSATESFPAFTVYADTACAKPAMIIETAINSGRQCDRWLKGLLTIFLIPHTPFLLNIEIIVKIYFPDKYRLV
jgi:hypothetical protein